MQLRTYALFRNYKGHTVINDDGENLSFNTAVETEKKPDAPAVLVINQPGESQTMRILHILFNQETVTPGSPLIIV